MLRLLSSYWFIALGSLLVPILIHLWSKKQSRVIKLGTLKWLTTGVNNKSRNLQFKDWPLLLLRCLLLALLVMVLVNPVWEKAAPKPLVKYAWIAPELLAPTNLTLVQNTLDSLIAQQYELREFNSGYTILTPEIWQAIKSGELVKTDSARQINYWNLAKEIDHTFPATEHIIFTSQHVHNFSGSRPGLSANVQWIPVSIIKTQNWVQEAWQTSPDSLLITVGETHASGVSFKSYRVASTINNQPNKLSSNLEYQIIREGNESFILTKADNEKIKINKEVLQIGIFHDSDRKPDVGYLKGVIQALKSYTGRPVNLQLFTQPTAIMQNAGFLFWLSNTAIPAHLKNRLAIGLFILKDAAKAEKPGVQNGWLRLPGLNQTISLLRQAKIVNNNQLPIWQNHFGEPLLYLERQGKGGIYYFGGRFNNQWNDLPESSFFPEVINSLILPAAPLKHDFRFISERQLQPVLASGITSKKNQKPELLDLRIWLVLMAALVFISERIWASRKGKLIL